jgi:AraC family transcriptional regulator of adaptative response/methylated-DNA-[protein]-cysteine methyltransferase
MSPQQPPTSAEKAARSVAATLERDPQSAHTLASLAGSVGVSPGHLQRTFTRVYGMSPAAYLRTVRAGRMREGLRAGRGVTDAGHESGFGSERAIYEHGTRALGMNPSSYRRGGKGLSIAYTTVATRLGDVVVGATERGVCCVLFLDGVSAAAVLRSEFPAAELVCDEATARPHAERVAAMLDGREVEGDVPLDLLGTPFQRQVWAVLRTLPPGATLTYAELAEKIGRPSATRAVANACGDNHAAVVVPCHRVVRSDGGLGGYKWGVERKRALLERERGSGGVQGPREGDARGRGEGEVDGAAG